MARVRLTKAQKELRDKKAEMVKELRDSALYASNIPFTFPEVKDKASAAHAALVDLAEAIGRVL